MRRLIWAVSSESTLFGIQSFNLCLSLNFFSSYSFLKKKKKTDDKYRLKFGAERVKLEPYKPRAICYASYIKSSSLRNNSGAAPASWYFVVTLGKHAYSNILKISPPKNENFQIKNSDIFHIFVDLNILFQIYQLTCIWHLHTMTHQWDWNESNMLIESLFRIYITKTHLFKYKENFTSKNWKFLGKKLWYFSYLCSNIDCGYSLEPPRWGGSNGYPQSLFWAEIRIIMSTPVNTSFTI